MVTIVLAVVALFAITSSCVVPITPVVAFVDDTFEGFPVVSYIPANPKAIVFVFHGSGGGANVVHKVATLDVLNALIADGYGIAATGSTESTERTGDKRWEVSNLSLTTNPDLARLARLHANLVDTTPLEASTPIVGIGHSNGGRFVTLWGEAWKDAGYPVRAIWASAGRVANPVTNAGGLTVPTFVVGAANDFTAPPGGSVDGYNETLAAGTAAELHINLEQKLRVVPFLRIPGIDVAKANEVVAALTTTGVWDAAGARIVNPVQKASQQAETAALPAWVGPAGLTNDISNAVALVLAVHQFTAEFKAEGKAFFDARLP